MSRLAYAPADDMRRLIKLGRQGASNFYDLIDEASARGASPRPTAPTPRATLGMSVPSLGYA